MLLRLAPLLCLTASASQFDFGLMENERLVMELAREERTLLAGLTRLQQQHPDPMLSEFLTGVKVQDKSAELFVQHPVNVYHLIKRNGILLRELIHHRIKVCERNFYSRYSAPYHPTIEMMYGSLQNEATLAEVRRLHNSTSLLKTVQLGDLQQCVAALVIMIHSYDLDLDNFSRGRLRNQSETSIIDCSTIPM